MSEFAQISPGSFDTFESLGNPDRSGNNSSGTSHPEAQEKRSEHHTSLSLPDGVILPKHQPWLHRFLHESHELSLEDLFQKNSATYETYRNTARPESDPVDTFRQEVKRPLNFSRRKEIRQAETRLTTQLEKDIQAILEEHRKLQYQSRIWPLNSADQEKNWPGLEHHSESKALAFLHSSKNYAEWKVNFIRYLRYRWENQQTDALQRFIDTHQDPKQLEETAPHQLLGGHTVRVLEKLDIPFIAVDKDAVIHPGKLQALNIVETDQVLVSPKFYLAMPDNPFVHAGNRAYVNLYQVVAVRREGSTDSPEFFLLADFYYAPLSVEELSHISAQFLPQQPVPQAATEQLILETTGVVPDEFTHAAPFELFLSMARSLKRDVALESDPSLRFVQNQAENQEFIQQQKTNVHQGAALFSQILLTEYALSRYFPNRREYVGEVLYRTFEVVLIAVLTGQELTHEKSQKILEEYRRTLVLEVEKLSDRDVNWDSYSVRGKKARSHDEVQDYFNQPDIHVQQQQAAWKNKELIEKGNLFMMALEPFIHGVATGVPSCASCLLGAAAKLGGVKAVPSSMSAGSLSAGAGGAAGAGSGGFGNGSWFGSPGFMGMNGYSGGSAGPWQDSSFLPGAIDSFLRRGFSSAGDAYGAFGGAFIHPNELLTYLMIGERSLSVR